MAAESKKNGKKKSKATPKGKNTPSGKKKTKGKGTSKARGVRADSRDVPADKVDDVLDDDSGPADFEIKDGELMYCHAVDKHREGSLAEAEVFYLMAMNVGHKGARESLGRMYTDIGDSYRERGKAEEAKKWYLRCADLGVARGMCALAMMYEEEEAYYYGIDDPECIRKEEAAIAEAAKWWLKAAELGVPKAQCAMGFRYSAGDGVPMSDEESVKWYRKAAEQGSAKAQFELGEYYNCFCDDEGAGEEAVKWYEQAAENKNGKSEDEDYVAYAMSQLGVMYKDGRKVAQSKEEAIKWFKKAAARGDEDSIGELKKMGVEWG